MPAAIARPVALPLASPRALPQMGAAPTMGERSAIPLAHASIAVWWLVTAGLLLARGADAVAAGTWGAPPLVAATHALTLGWLATIAVGVLHQIGPAAMGVAPRSTRLWLLLLPLLTLGTLGVVRGAWSGLPLWSRSGWLLVASALAGYAWVLLGPGRAAPSGRIVARRVAWAFTALAGGILLAGARLLWAGAPDLTALRTGHIALGLGGFGTLLSIGVGLQLLPGFFGARDLPVRLGHTAFRLVALGVALAALTAVAPMGAAPWWGLLRRVGIALAALGALSFALQTWRWMLGRRSDRVDPTQGGVTLAVTFLAAAGAIALTAALAGTAPDRLLLAWGLLTLPGWLLLFVVSVLVRIVPLQAWMERFSTPASPAGRPRTRVADLALPWLAWTALGLVAGGVLALATAALTGAVALGIGGGLAVASAGAGLAAYIAHALLRR
jgi:hypothetical protein